MAGCASCLHKNVHPNVCSDCLGGTHFKPRKKTNADRVRAMSDEELADFLEDVAMQGGIETGGHILAWIDWLKQEASDDNFVHTDP